MSDLYYYVCIKNKHDSIGYCNRSEKGFVEVAMKHPEDYTHPLYMTLQKRQASKKVGFFQLSNEIQILQQTLQTTMIFIQHKGAR